MRVTVTSLRLGAAALTAAVMIALLAAAGGARAAGVTVQSTTTGGPIPSGFIGLSIEMRNLELYAGTDPSAIDPPFLSLVNQIDPDQSPVLRIGGDTTDWSWYPVPGVRRPRGVSYDLTPQWMDVARATAADLRGKLVLGVNLEAGSRRDATAEANAMVKRIGRRYIEALEIGNEPELYSAFAWYHTASGERILGRRKQTWSPARYARQFSRFAHAMPNVPIAGPASGAGAWLDELGSFLRSEPLVQLTTMHAYPLKHCSPSHVITIPELLADSASDRFAEGVAPFVSIAHRHGTQLRIDELNAISCGGTRGVSNSFASALWMLNTLFELASTGVDGINVHTVPNAINEILGPSHAAGHWSIRVHPEYYAMIMFAQAAPAGSHLLRLSTALPPGVEAWATQAINGDIHVVLINKRASAAQTLPIRIPSAVGPATAVQLRAGSLAATSGVTLGGQTFGAATTTGVLAGPSTRSTVAPRNGSYTVTLPPASATMLTLPAPPAKAFLSALAAPRLLAPLLTAW